MQLFFWEKKSQLELWFHNLDVHSIDVIRYASSFGVGFVAGMILKRWSKYIILGLVSLVLTLAVLQGFAIITINFLTIQRLMGLQNITNSQLLLVALQQTAQKYTWEMSCSGIGFIIGFKTG